MQEHTNRHTHARMHVHAHMRVHRTHARMHKCTNAVARTHACTHARVRVCVRAHACVCAWQERISAQHEAELEVKRLEIEKEGLRKTADELNRREQMIKEQVKFGLDKQEAAWLTMVNTNYSYC